MLLTLFIAHPNMFKTKKSPEYLVSWLGLDKPPKLSEQEMANIFSDVEGKSDDKFDLFKKLFPN